MRYTGPKVRLSRRAGVPLTRKAVKYFEKRPYPPGEHGRRVRRSTSDYAVRQAEKQKLRWYYDLSEKQLARVYENAKKRAGRTGEEMIAELELRLATVVLDRKSTRLNSSHVKSSYAVFCLKKKRGCE